MFRSCRTASVVGIVMVRSRECRGKRHVIPHRGGSGEVPELWHATIRSPRGSVSHASVDACGLNIQMLVESLD